MSNTKDTISKYDELVNLLYDAERCLAAWVDDAINRNVPDDDPNMIWAKFLEGLILDTLRRHKETSQE